MWLLIWYVPAIRFESNYSRIESTALEVETPEGYAFESNYSRIESFIVIDKYLFIPYLVWIEL